MQYSYLEEIVASLSIIIALLSYHFGFYALFVLFTLKSGYDIWCLINIVVTELKRERNKKEATNEPR